MEFGIQGKMANAIIAIQNSVSEWKETEKKDMISTKEHIVNGTSVFIVLKCKSPLNSRTSGVSFEVSMEEMLTYSVDCLFKQGAAFNKVCKNVS